MTTYPVNVIVSQDTPPSGGAAGRLWLRPTEWILAETGAVSQGYLLYKYEGGTSIAKSTTNTNSDASNVLLAFLGIGTINDLDSYRIPGWTVVGIALGHQSVLYDI